MLKHRIPAALVLLLAAGSAAAHPGHPSASYVSGFLHPLGGLDHLLAMMAVGFFAAQHRGRARWMLPIGFVAAMLLGAALGAAGIALPLVEASIATSVLVLGLLVASFARLPLAASLPLVAAFAVAHGYAHVAEAGNGSLFSFAAGFAFMTALLHGVGFLAARWLPDSPWGRSFQRIAGGAMAVTGYLLLGA